MTKLNDDDLKNVSGAGGVIGDVDGGGATSDTRIGPSSGGGSEGGSGGGAGNMPFDDQGGSGGIQELE